MSDLEDKDATSNVVSSFLERVVDAATMLATKDGNVKNKPALQLRDPLFLVEVLSDQLLEAGKPDVLATDVIGLPDIGKVAQLTSDNTEDDDDENTPVYHNRRTDYLRLLLRVISPVSMQVASRICNVVLESDDPNVRKAFVLLVAHWLPVAPHLTTMITEVLGSIPAPWEDSIESDRGDILFLYVEASFKLCKYFSRRSQLHILHQCWNWSFLFKSLNYADSPMMEDSDPSFMVHVPKAIQWYSLRCLAMLLNWSAQVSSALFKKYDLLNELVPWEIHPWIWEDEEMTSQVACFGKEISLWSSENFRVPTAEEVAYVWPTSNFLSHVGNGLFVYRQGSLEAENKGVMGNDPVEIPKKKALVPTNTTCSNLALLGAALCQEPYPPPIMLCGPHGSGKSSLIRELLRICRPREELLELHMDEETDSKTLIGSYSTTDIPGEFAWRPGALTLAVREGRWILLEDVDSVPIEIQASIVKLMEDRVLPLGNGKHEVCHPNFRIFGTCTTAGATDGSDESYRFSANRGGGKRILSPTLWRNVHVQSMEMSEMTEVAKAEFPSIPDSIAEAALALMQGFLGNPTESSGTQDTTYVTYWTGGRCPSVRDLFKLLARLSTGLCFERNVTYATESQRMQSMGESVDVFVGSCTSAQRKLEFGAQVAGPAFGVSTDLALHYLDQRRPEITTGTEHVEIGRAKIHIGKGARSSPELSDTFAQTSHALRLMESIGVSVQQNEPILLVGETGCGKTTVIQHLAALCERDLIVQNLSLQTDSTDLLGGFKPLELKNIARDRYRDFVDLFVSTFSRKQNMQFLQFVATAHEKANWKQLSSCFQRAAKMGTHQMKERLAKDRSSRNIALAANWKQFRVSVEKFETQRVSGDVGLAFVFAEGALVDAIQSGKWVLLDEINLASSDTLQRLCGLLDDPSGSITLTERGDATPIPRHPNFRLFAAMNPATDAGKKDLPISIRSRFTELYVDELLDPLQLRSVAAQYLNEVLPADGQSPEHKEVVVTVVDIYLKCRELAENVLTDGSGHKPRYTLRTLARALRAAKSLVLHQHIPLTRSIFEGFQLAFEGALDSASKSTITKVLKSLIMDKDTKKNLDHPGRRPGKNDQEYVLVKPFWINTGENEPVDWSESTKSGKSRFILTPSVTTSLRRLALALSAGPWPVLLEGPTSAGKTTLVEYMAARCGHHVVRINNHEHTDIQEYTGSFTADQNGTLKFRDGLLVKALRLGYWVILDELNLAPTEVLEALNRLLDDNRELFLAETNETVKPHPNFRLFATQNPSGIYGGRKPLSRAFRNRFVEIHMGDIPSNEMTTILEKRCGCPPSSAKRLVDVMVSLRYQRSKKNVFLGKDSFITPRDLLRWAERKSSSKQELAQQGYMLLAERLRSDDEKQMVQEVLEETLKVSLDMDEIYYGNESQGNKLLAEVEKSEDLATNPLLKTIAPTKSFLRMLSLVATCVEQKEPVLLVGDTGCGKTTVVQLLSLVYNKSLYAVNCHATTETSDLLGGLRPVRGRDDMMKTMNIKLRKFLTDEGNEKYCQKLRQMPMYQSQGNGMDSDIMWERELSVEQIMEVAQELSKGIQGEPRANTSGEGPPKKRKTSPTTSKGVPTTTSVSAIAQALVDELDSLAKKYNSLFEWSDGPLVQSMKEGQMLLLDEMSLAEDAVLERLNSVLEPSRTLVLAEKGDDGSVGDDGRIVVAHGEFRIFATMNPGGDFGKRELSPALRSRFTEIWVPAVTERVDFELVLGRTLAPSMGENNLSPLLQKMLDYVEWFNQNVCKGTTASNSGVSLSLRDVLSWARFISAVGGDGSRSLAQRDAYVHGAALMHLDGLGLGSGFTLEEAADLKTQAESFLTQQFGDGMIVSTTSTGPFLTHAPQWFGVEPFFVPLGQQPIPASQFDLKAPTTATNAFRVLRAMQLRKPVLLEGSPGVGKTSLITALAAASGNKLVRINLSEQTDIADLMGSDLPVQSSTAGGASFEWCDGIFLTAIKEGSWVLLDELNLATQSVLEGLNSCLDHRGTVFIPELGKTFECPSTFRVFGAQNPLGQGGGRKGLPKSFLNRFTKVYVDALTDSDLRVIVGSQFGSIDASLVDKMISFNKAVQADVVDKRLYGLEGAPWEFNLRDIFRWCQLLERGSASVQSSARNIYYQRFRNAADRRHVNQSFMEHFGLSLEPEAPPALVVSDEHVQIGDTRLLRKAIEGGDNLKSPLHGAPEVHLSSLSHVEAIARCIAYRWPSLLIGPAASGKTSTVATLAELCNANLVQKSLSPTSDVTELLGCFEQVETNEMTKLFAEEVCDVVDEFFEGSKLSSALLPGVWEKYSELNRTLLDPSSVGNATSLESAASALLSMLLQVALSEENPSPALKARLQELEVRKAQVAGNGNEESGHFQWRDGILVEAMEKGEWLLLDNVNLCPSSVLDRLNSVMERNGELVLSECGTLEDNGSTSHRVIQPHQNFRVFLCMDAAQGEVSRAMRNRCIEIFFPTQVDCPLVADTQVSLRPSNIADVLGLLHSKGLRVFEIANLVSSLHVEECQKMAYRAAESPSIRAVAQAIGMATSMLSMGISGSQVLADFIQLAFERPADTPKNVVAAFLDQHGPSNWTPLVQGGPVRDLWLQDSVMGSAKWAARHLRMFQGQGKLLPSTLMASQILKLVDGEELAKYAHSKLLDLHNVDPRKLFEVLVKSFLLESCPSHFGATMAFFDRYTSGGFVFVKYLKQAIISLFRACERDYIEEPMLEFLVRHTVSIATARIDQVAREKVWAQELTNSHDRSMEHSTPSVLETSILIHEAILDRSAVSCPVTPILYPFFVQLESLMGDVIASSIHLGTEEDLELSLLAKNVLFERDQCWNLLRETEISMAASNAFLGFDEAEFLVQWKWLKQALIRLKQNHLVLHLSFSTVESTVGYIDKAVFGDVVPSRLIHSVQKHLTRPDTPREARHWETISNFRNMASSCSLEEYPAFSPFIDGAAMVDLETLCERGHPTLYVEGGLKKDLIALMATLNTAWGSKSASSTIRRSLDGVLDKKMSETLNKQKEQFVRNLSTTRYKPPADAVDSKVSSDSLEKLDFSSEESRSAADAFVSTVGQLLTAFSRVQVSPLVEYAAVVAEGKLLGCICNVLVNKYDGADLKRRLSQLSFEISAFMEMALTSVVWSPGELRVYQELLWLIDALNSGSLTLDNIKMLMPTLLACWNYHCRVNSFNQLGSISARLDVPSLWNEDSSNEETKKTHRNEGRYTFGSSRICQHVRSEFLMSLLSPQVVVAGQDHHSRSFTVENYQHRLSQFGSIVNILASTTPNDPSAEELHVIQWQLVEILSALHVGLNWPSYNELQQLLEKPQTLIATDLAALDGSLKHYSEEAAKIYFSYISPLMRNLQACWFLKLSSGSYAKDLAFASIRLGLLQLRFSMPESPLDPGKAPIAKIALIDRRVDEIRFHATAKRLESGFVCGDFAPIQLECLLDRGEGLLERRDSLKQEVVERPVEAAPFPQLFRQVSDFVNRMLSKEQVINMAESVSSRPDQIDLEKVKNWQLTATSFCRELSDEYPEYEDVTMNLQNAIRRIQDGIEFLVNDSEQSKPREFVGVTQQLVQYPFVATSTANAATFASFLLLAGQDHSSKGKDMKLFALGYSVLGQLALKAQIQGLTVSDVLRCRRVIDQLFGGRQQDTGKVSKSALPSDDETFREQFPDHRSDFNVLLESTDDDSDVEEKQNNPEDSLPTELTTDQLELVYSVLQEIFQGSGQSSSNRVRTLTFHANYNAAYQLSHTTSESSMEKLSGHILALAMSTPQKNESMIAARRYRKWNVVDFQNDPNPSEVVEAKEPLLRLMARSTQLLAAFPGHAVLIGICRVCDKVSKLDVMTTPLAKVLTGLEVLLREAQDWEQHASHRVQLGEPLTQVQRLVAKWRKLELESWPQLIKARRQRQERKVLRHFMNLQSALRFLQDVTSSHGNHPDTPISQTASDTPVPSWVWKGLSKRPVVLRDNESGDVEQEVSELTKLLDTFMLTSTLGQFSERLLMLRNCSLQLEKEYLASQDSRRQKQYQALVSVHAYYSQFEPMFEERIVSTMAPFESKLKDEAKLAKWDEQTYYAMADSTERNHRKLMKILAEVDESLEHNVGILIQEENIRGVRSSAESNGEIATSIPSKSLLFPYVRDENETTVHLVAGTRQVIEKGYQWSSIGPDTHPQDSHGMKMRKYAKKMEQKLISLPQEQPRWGQKGVDICVDFCDAIFERIESLRTKSTRPMKERALVELFRELRKNGFSALKWSVPRETQQIEKLFQLPSPITNHDTDRCSQTLKKAEKYYQRCLAETITFRNESQRLGSQHMTKSDAEKMLGFCESGLFLIAQQRTAVSVMMHQHSVLKKYASILEIENRELPMPQSSRMIHHQDFDHASQSALESLRQVSLYISLSQDLLDSSAKSEWARDTVAKIESSVARLSDVSKHGGKDRQIVSISDLNAMTVQANLLSEVCGIVEGCKASCAALSCLPTDCFDTSIQCMSHAIDLSKKSMVQFCKVGVTDADYFEALEKAVERTLITFQNFVPDGDSGGVFYPIKPEKDSEEPPLWECHREMMQAWSNCNLESLNSTLECFLEKLRTIHDSSDQGAIEKSVLVGLGADLGLLVAFVEDQTKVLLDEMVMFYAKAAKLVYIAVRVFRVLLSKGFCSDETAENDVDGESGDVNGMMFGDDNDGTGMGEGEGRQDVTDQLESEEQIAGLKSDDNDNNKDDQQQQRQLNEEEADQGMEMEADFEGDMYDLPERPDNEESKDEGEEELDREMGEEGSPDDQVVDEKMWNDSDDEGEGKQEEEKFEKDSGVEGEAIDGAIRTKEDTEETDNGDTGEDKNKMDDNTQEMENEDQGGDINEDNEDRYEEKHGVDVQNNGDEDANGEPENEMELGDDLNLDGEDMDDANDPEESPDALDDNADDGDDASKGEDLNQGMDVDEEDAEGDDEGAEQVAAPSGVAEAVENEDSPEAEEDNKADETPLELPPNAQAEHEGYGVRNESGKDAVNEDDVDNDDSGNADDVEAAGEATGSAQANQAQSDSNAGTGVSEQEVSGDNSPDTQDATPSEQVPNPFKNPGDASKFWHRKLNVVEPSPDEEQAGETPDEQMGDSSNEPTNGEFQYTAEEATTQVLGETRDEDAVELDQPEQEEPSADAKEKSKPATDETTTREKKDAPASTSKKRQASAESELPADEMNEEDNSMEVDQHEEIAEQSESANEEADEEEGVAERIGNLVVSEALDRTMGSQNTPTLGKGGPLVVEDVVSQLGGIEITRARAQWLQIQGDTSALSRRLCEKLRLVMEPLVASKLRGDYRSGKRINMKRVIGYIASGYRKDKIWLRRTKPAKRDYRVLLAVDDSESMKKSGAGDMALRSLATLAVGMNQLEIGELGIASFGEDMKLLHPFNMPFTADSGTDMVMNFQFDQQRTRTSLCVQSAIDALDSMGGSSSMQLVFLISDGRIERDSRDTLKRLVREMMERNILLAMIIVEGEHKKKDSIVNMKEVSFEKGKPVVKRFIEDYPFPYYLVLEDMTTLPEVLGDALRQWFEMLGQLNNPR
eukprot:Nitzschia sp. Nitz4//scaffold122_size67431//7852//24798//NITZ4_006082-RA/size67431-snap-gene-0.19-mRNA-1//1//CDS//3329534394//670//frame0